MKEKANTQTGFTLIEVILVISLIGLLMTFSFMPTRQVTTTTSLEQLLNQIITDLRAQQSFAMLGFNQTTGTADNYSIYFQTTSYTTFKGGTYNASHESNVISAYPTQTTMSNTTFPNQTITFNRLTGYVSNWSATTNAISFRNSSQTKTMTINQLGTVLIL